MLFPEAVSSLMPPKNVHTNNYLVQVQIAGSPSKGRILSLINVFIPPILNAIAVSLLSWEEGNGFGIKMKNVRILASNVKSAIRGYPLKTMSMVPLVTYATRTNQLSVQEDLSDARLNSTQTS